VLDQMLNAETLGTKAAVMFFISTVHILSITQITATEHC